MAKAEQANLFFPGFGFAKHADIHEHEVYEQGSGELLNFYNRSSLLDMSMVASSTDLFDSQLMQSPPTAQLPFPECVTASDLVSSSQSIAGVIDQNLYGDSTYCSAAEDLVEYPEPELSYEHVDWQTLLARTPEIPIGSPGKQREHPVYPPYYLSNDISNYTSQLYPSIDPLQTNTWPLKNAAETAIFRNRETAMPPYSGFPEESTGGIQDLQPSGASTQFSTSNCDSTMSKIPDKILHNLHPCAECTFTRVKCSGIPGLPCTRCAKQLYSARESKPVSIFSTEIKENGGLLRIIFFDMQATQALLCALRHEAGQLSNLGHGITLENSFSNPILCHMASTESPGHHGWATGVQIVIKHLATTPAAHLHATSSGLNFPEPGLNASQLDSFLAILPRMKDLRNLTPTEQGIIASALKIADYIGILFNWDANTVCFEQHSQGYPGAQAKNIVLETMYAMTYRIQDLLKKLLFEVKKVLIGRRDPNHDPATISCALWILYASLNTFQQLKWNAKSLQNLKEFLNDLHCRSNGAMTLIDHYRREVAFVECGKKSLNLHSFRKLVRAKKIAKSAIAFTYEQFRPQGNAFLSRMSTFSREQSYTDVLEDIVADNEYLYQVDDSFFLKQHTEARVSSSLTDDSVRLINEFNNSADQIVDDEPVTSMFSNRDSSDELRETKPRFSLTTQPANGTRTGSLPKNHDLNVELSMTYKNSDKSLAAEIHRMKARLLQLEGQHEQGNQCERPFLDQDRMEGLEPYLEVPEPVGPPLEMEKASFEAKVATFKAAANS